MEMIQIHMSKMQTEMRHVKRIRIPEMRIRISKEKSQPELKKGWWIWIPHRWIWIIKAKFQTEAVGKKSNLHSEKKVIFVHVLNIF